MSIMPELHALQRAEAFIEGFEDDRTQVGITALLRDIRIGIAAARARPGLRVDDEPFFFVRALAPDAYVVRSPDEIEFDLVKQDEAWRLQGPGFPNRTVRVRMERVSRESALIRAGEELFTALERYVRWKGTGGKREQQADQAVGRALARWAHVGGSCKRRR
jgi:hypothetical protein